MKSLVDHLSQYAAYHRDPRNIASHFIGIPLIVAVRDAGDRNQILESGWARMNNSPTQEHATALIEMAKIANHRFDDLVAEANPIHTARTQRLDHLGH